MDLPEKHMHRYAPGRHVPTRHIHMHVLGHDVRYMLEHASEQMLNLHGLNTPIAILKAFNRFTMICFAFLFG